MSDQTSIQKELEKLHEKHPQMKTVVDLVLQGSYPEKEPQTFEGLYRPFFEDVCCLKGYKPGDIPLPPARTFFAMDMYYDWLNKDARYIFNYIEVKRKEAAWKTPYVGEAHVLLRDTIDEIRMKEASSWHSKFTRYGNFFSIIQGSGTGKSRVVDKLSESVFTIPFVLRNEKDESGFHMSGIQGYPVMDEYKGHGSRRWFPLLDRFSVARNSASIVQRKYYLQYAQEWLEKEKSNSLEDTILRWRQYVADDRIKFHTDASKSQLDSSEFELDSQNLLVMRNIQSKSTYTKNIVKLLEARSKTNDSQKPYILFYFDEAHNLSMEKTSEADGSMSRTAYQCLCKAFSYFTDAPVFALFISTYSRLSEFSHVKEDRSWSSRPSPQLGDPGEALHPPYVELPFDIGPPSLSKILVKEGAHTISEICAPTFMARFGRPLFWALSDHMDNENELVNLAVEKLGVHYEGNLSPPYPIHEPDFLPLLAIRVDLTFDSSREEAIYVESLLVASSMRTVYSVPDHRQYLWGGYPSEPILAEAASRKLYQLFSAAAQPPGESISASKLEMLINTYKSQFPSLLLEWFLSGLLSKEESGAMVARLLLTLAHDLALFDMTKDLISDNRRLYDVTFSQKIPVVKFLSALISPQYINDILDSTPRNMNGSSLREAFKDAFVHFTHFVRGHDAWIVTDQACMIFMARGAAIQGHATLPDLDLIIPVCMKDERLNRYIMSAIFIQLKNVLKQQSVHIDVEDGGKGKFHFFSPGDTDAINQRPYITITMDLGISGSQYRTGYPWTAPSSNLKEPATKRRTTHMQFSPSKVSQRKTTHPRYAINIFGCSPSTYNVVADKMDYQTLLAPTSLLSEHPRQGKDFLDAVRNRKPFFTSDSYAFAKMESDSNLHKENVNVSQTIDESVEVGEFDDGEENDSNDSQDYDSSDDDNLSFSEVNPMAGDKRKRIAW
ncbi:hypothetical protein H0H92_002846 [Tricholoma furcatifolium]|nr:hypothetical protein H0H92_002846 [Tricholoma furcatifolium]